MELLLTTTSIEIFPGIHQAVWFLDLKEGNQLTDLCNGSKDYCLAQKEEWAKKLNIDGGEKHRKLKSCGAR
jgi:hypothetical protein